MTSAAPLFRLRVTLILPMIVLAERLRQLRRIFSP